VAPIERRDLITAERRHLYLRAALLRRTKNNRISGDCVRPVRLDDSGIEKVFEKPRRDHESTVVLNNSAATFRLARIFGGLFQMEQYYGSFRRTLTE
jgi:hypothetical protein